MMSVLLTVSWVFYVVCYVCLFFAPGQVTRYLARTIKRQYMLILAAIWVLGMCAMVVMCIHYGVRRVLGIQALLGMLCIHSYNVAVVRSIEG